MLRSTLLRAHLAAAALHAALTVSALVSAAESVQTAPVFEAWPQWNYTRCAARFGDSSIGVCPDTNGDDVRVVGRVNMTWVLILSQLATCAAHCLQAYWLLEEGLYLRLTRYGLKLAFWMEYALTASTVAYIVIYYSGVVEIRAQVVSLASQTTLMFLGMLLDLLRHASLQFRRAAQAPESRVARRLCVPVFVVGFANVLTVWLPSLYKLSIGDNDAPAWVFWVVLLEFVLYTSFGFAQLAFFLPFLTGSSPSRPDGDLPERAVLLENLTLIALSFISKALLNTAFSVCLVYGLCQED